MVCTLINDLPTPPLGVVILTDFTDSKSSLQTLAYGTKNRGEMQTEINFLAYQIMTNGTDFSLMWLPSHTGIRGNEMADKAAKAAAMSTMLMTDIRLSCQEAKQLLANLKREEREQTLSKTCEERGWIHLPYNRKGHHFPLPPRPMSLLRRLRTDHSRIYWDKLVCQCGKTGHLTHMFKGCDTLKEEMSSLIRYRRENALSLGDFLRPHPSLGEKPMMVLVTSLFTSTVPSWFWSACSRPITAGLLTQIHWWNLKLNGPQDTHFVVLASWKAEAPAYRFASIPKTPLDTGTWEQRQQLRLNHRNQMCLQTHRSLRRPGLWPLRFSCTKPPPDSASDGLRWHLHT